jgi:hypothetical protein
MADEPDSIILRHLRDIRATLEAHGDVLSRNTAMLNQHTGALTRIEKRADDLYTMSTHTLGVAVSAHEKYLALEARVDQLSERVQQLETKT